MKLVLYHSVESTCAQKVRLVMAEKELHWTEVPLNLRKGEQFEPDYLRLNPKAVVPTLVHDGTAVRESTVINEYLEDCFPQPPLRPADPRLRARMRLLVKAIDDEVHPAIGVLSYAIFLRHQMNAGMTPEELQRHFERVADPARRERQQKTHAEGLRSPAARPALAALARFVAQLDEALSEGPWLAGDDWSLADAAALPYVQRARALHLDPLWADRKQVADWLERGVTHAAGLGVENPWGSPGFHKMVAGYADAARAETQALLDELRH